MLAEVRHSILREKLLAPGCPLWVAVSGGIDSVVLLHVLRQLGHACHVAHVDHGLRGSESDGDRAFVEDLAHREGLPFRSVRVDPKAAAKGVSVQMAARELRYGWFKELLREGPSVMALGHHRDDAVETLLLNLMRGTGSLGWQGIPPVTMLQEGRFCRPLLRISRKQIAAYAKEHGLAFREDASNTDPKYLRNRVRHELLPLLENMRPGSTTVLAREVELLSELSKASAQQIAREAQGVKREGDAVTRIPLAQLRESVAPHLLLMHLLRDTTMHPDQLDQMVEAAQQGSTGAQFHVGAFTVTVAKDHLAVHGDGAAPDEFSISADGARQGRHGPFSWRTCLPHEMEFPMGRNTAWLDMAKLQFPLVVRPWHPGDRMRPVGLGGSKLVSDILTDDGVPRQAKRDAHVVLSGGETVWLAGFRMAQGFSPDGRTEIVLRLDFRGEGVHHL